MRRCAYDRGMSSSVPAVLLAAGGVGLAHSVLPDHWVPLAVVSRSRHDPLPRVARLSLFAGLAHVAISLVLGGFVIGIGLSVRSAIESRSDQIVGGVLMLTGLAFLVADATGRSHAAKHRAAQDHDHQHEHRVLPRGLHLLVPFGAAASPDLTILPVFLAAATLGTGAALGSLAVFTAVTLATFVGLTTLATAGGYQLTSPWLDRYANVVTAVVLIVIGALITAHVL